MFKFKDRNLISLAVIVFAILGILFLSSVPRNLLLSVIKNPLGIANFFSREAGALVFFHRNFVENQRLQKENYLLKQKINFLRELYAENARLKRLLSFKEQSSYKVIVARVVGRSADSWSSAIIIDKGSSSGIKTGMAAITYSGLAGRVIEIQANTGKIMLVNDPNLGVSAVNQRSRQEGLVSGTLGSYLLMRYIPEDADIKENDLMLTSGMNQGYPKGIAIGSVVEVGEEFSGLSRYALVRPAVDLSNIEEIMVVVP